MAPGWTPARLASACSLLHREEHPYAIGSSVHARSGGNFAACQVVSKLAMFGCAAQKPIRNESSPEDHARIVLSLIAATRQFGRSAVDEP